MTSSKLAALPSMPGTVIRLLQMFADPEVCIDEVVDTIKTDAALAGRILKAANSPSGRVAREVSGLKQAAVMMGKKTISTLALSFSVTDKSLSEGPDGDLFKAFWSQSLMTGVASSVLAKKYRCLPHDEAFLVGLLSRIGRLGALSFATEQFTAAAHDCDQNGVCIDTVPLPAMGMTCEQLTLAYMQSWLLPESFISYVGLMHDASERDRMQLGEESRTQEATPDASTVLRIAGAMGQFFTGENTGVALATIYELLDPYLNAGETVDQLLHQVLEEFNSYGKLLEIDKRAFATPAELHAQAMSHLMEIMLAPETETPHTEESISEVKWLKRRVTDLSARLTLDPMTSIYNRAYFDMQLEKSVAMAALENRFVTVLFIDINEFKQVNDVHGHDVGDSAIRAVAHKLKSAVRESDIVARYGGDEFVVLCKMTERDGLEAQAERITQMVEGLTAVCRGISVDISLAIGGASGLPDGTKDFAERLLRDSDEAMYEAKESRCNPVVRRIISAGYILQKPKVLAGS